MSKFQEKSKISLFTLILQFEIIFDVTILDSFTILSISNVQYVKYIPENIFCILYLIVFAYLIFHLLLFL